MSKTTASPAENSRRFTARFSRWQSCAEILLIMAVFFAATGDLAPNVNEAHYLSRLKHYWNPAWCRGDLFLESTDTQLVFIWLFGWITRFVSLTATAWIGRFIAWTALAWSWQRLSIRIVPRRFVSVLSAALFIGLNHYLHMAGEWVVGGVEAKGFAYAFVLWALGEMLDNHWNSVWLLLGAATAFHPLVGGWSGIVCVGVWLIDARREQTLSAMLPGLVGGALLGLIGILPALLLTWNVAPEVVTEANRIYVFDRLPHHLSPLTLPTDEVTRRLGGHAVLLSMLFVLSRTIRRASRSVVTDDSAQSVEQLNFTDRAARFYRSLHRIVLFALGAAILAGIGLAIELMLRSEPQLAAKLLRYYWFRLTDFGPAMAVALQISSLIAMGFERRRLWAMPLLVTATVFGCWYPVSATIDRFKNPIPPADAKMLDYPAWVEVCDWIAKNTPPDSVFITPRLNSSFKWRTGRVDVANRKDIPQNPAGIVAWYERLKDIYTTQFGGIDQNIDSVGALGDERVLELTRKYHAKYVLSDRGQLLSFPKAFENEEYVVYRIEDGESGHGK